MNNYKEYNDYELIYLIREGNEEANNILYKKYKPVIELKARKYYRSALNKGLDYNDLVQEGMIGLSEALRDFNNHKDVKLSTFASLCIERQISTAVTKASRKKHMVLNESISYDFINDDDDKPLIDYLAEEKEGNPLEYFVDREEWNETFEKIRNELTDFEYQVLELKINNFNYNEIATILDKTPKSIDNALQRIKRKTKVILDKKD
ncbi:MAG: sigma-70 family RNA polymerase sigma factor [Bacilli bacterium]|nr:sigma-70 family RNA polymerase sigma factor [Bacilli bacterium]